MMIEPIFDQSVFVRAAVKGVEHEILLVGGLVAAVVLLFLGSWRSTMIVLTSIPLALLCSVIGLYLAGATFNLMTLGGLALAIGILVDNALVEIENIKRQISLGKGVRQAINPCAGCHTFLDPIGFSMEHFDVTGAWRTVDTFNTDVDSTGVLKGRDGSIVGSFDGDTLCGFVLN